MAPTTFGGAYSRSLLPGGEFVKVRRIRCLECLVTHALLPAFLLGQVRYGADTLTPYLKLAHTESLTALTVWQQNKANGPEDFSTLYRWLRRLGARLATLLPFLHQRLLEWAPDSELKEFETAILKASSQPLSITALCQLVWWLSEQLLTVSGQILEQTPPMGVVAFLNYLCFRKTGATLLSARPP